MNLVERSLDNRDLTSFLELRFDAAMLKRLWRRIVERRRRNIAELEQIEIYRLFLGWEASKANCINRVYGAGDGNRTHVRNLGSCRHLASEAIPKRQNQGGGFGALQAPATNRLITGSSSALRMITLAGS